MTITRAAWPETVFVLIPSYKSAGPLHALLSRLLETAPTANVCVVDDASFDGTDRVCDGFGVDRIEHSVNMGKGVSLCDGFRHALERGRCEWIITMDADGQHAVEDIPAFLDYVARNPGAGMCIGARSMAPSTMPLPRIVSNTLTSRILSFLTGRNIPDSQCGFRIYSARLLEKAPCACPRFEMESEIILKAAHLNFPIGTVRVRTLYFNGPSHIAHVRDTLRWVRSIAGIWWNLRKQGIACHE